MIMKVMLAQLNPTVGAIEANAEKIIQGINLAKQQDVHLILFPELALSGYPPEDLLLRDSFIEENSRALERIIAATAGIAAVVGMPSWIDSKKKSLANSAAIIDNGSLLGFQHKKLLPTYNVFEERRYFTPSQEKAKLWTIGEWRIGITLCEDIWGHSSFCLPEAYYYCTDPVKELAVLKPDLVLNLSASPFDISKSAIRKQVCCRAAQTLGAPLLLCNQVGGNGALLFDGNSLLVDGSGTIVYEADSFVEELTAVEITKGWIKPGGCEGALKEAKDDGYIEDIYHALVMGIRDYFQKSNFKKACLGLSGGIDSAVVASLAAAALGKENVLALALPSRFSSENSFKDAGGLAENLAIEYKIISIEEPFAAFLNCLEEPFKNLPWDLTEENLQARIRGIILMAFSNKLGYLVLATGNKSELAVGYSTLYGDMCGALAVIGDLIKSDVYKLAAWINREKNIIPANILKKAPSAELRHGQLDSDSLPPYDIVDCVVQKYIEEGKAPKEIASLCNIPIETVEKLVQMIHRSEYKRRQSPLILRVTPYSFTNSLRFPVVQKWI